MLLFTWAQLRTFLFLVLSSTRNRSTATKMCWMKKTLYEEDDGCHCRYCQIGIGESCSSPDSWCRWCNLINASLKSERSLIGPIFQIYWERSTNSFCIESTHLPFVKTFCASLSIWMQTSSVRAMLSWDSRNTGSIWKRSWIPSNPLFLHLLFRLWAT